MKNHHRKDPKPCRICERDTRVYGYIYGACRRCVRRALDKETD